jgi:hypothetical protein
MILVNPQTIFNPVWIIELWDERHIIGYVCNQVGLGWESIMDDHMPERISYFPSQKEAEERAKFFSALFITKVREVMR